MGYEGLLITNQLLYQLSYVGFIFQGFWSFELSKNYQN